jgi:hypothetical protein
MYAASGMAAAINGFFQGRDEETRRQNEAEDRKYQQGQRQFQAEQQTRQREQWGREDQLRQDLANIPSTATKTVKADPNLPQVDDNGEQSAAALPVTKEVAVPQDVQLRQAAEAYRKAGNFGEYLKAVGEADKLQLQRSSNLVAQLEATASGKTALQVAQDAQRIFDEDPFPHRIKAVRPGANGAVEVEIEYPDRGTTNTQTFATGADVTNALKAIYNPQGWQALQAERQKAIIKNQEELLKPRVLRPGEVFTAYDPVKREMVKLAEGNIPAGHEVMTDANGNTILRKIPAGAGGGGGGAATPSAGGKGKAPADLKTEVLDAIGDYAKTGGDKIPTLALAQANENAEMLATQNPNIPGRLIARAALEVALDPAKLRPAINPMTGKVDMVFQDDLQGNIAFHRGIADAIRIDRLPLDRLGATPEQVEHFKVDAEAAHAFRVSKMKEMTSSMLRMMSPQESERLRAAANDPRERAKLHAEITAQADQVIAQKVASNPEREAEIRQAVDAARQQRLQVLSNNLDLIFNYGPKPKPAVERTGEKVVGGLKAAASAASKYSPPVLDPLGISR